MKDHFRDLAIFGGNPAFADQLFVGRPNIGDRQAFLARVNDILDRRWLTNNGAYVQELERKLEEYLGVKHCIAMCNATIALEITIRALGMSGEVIVPSFTFIATPHSLQWQQITPVFCDIDPATHSLDPTRVESLITPRTTGIIGVHLWGKPCAIEQLEAIAQRRNLRLLFDAAHAFGCSHDNRMIGGFGDAEVFSFHATKFFNTFEGGAVTTNDDELAARIRLMKNFGFAGYDNVIYIGTNGKMSEVSAAMGLTSLEHLDDLIALNRRNHEAYGRGLAGLLGVRLVPYDGNNRYNYQYVVLEIDSESAGVDRDLLLQILHAENVMARRYFYPGCHQMEPYRSHFPHAGLLLPETEGLVQRVMSLPTGSAVTEEDISRISSIIRLVLMNGSEMTEALLRRGDAA
ncbi:MAG: aminotransferase class I/II-fold pyridoxal phosphate-dependent enzyme [Desulfobacteraceae bacterium]|nr:aminotransferase class I/II-fold pyridoxal phosphate-dependent enzyme [Desulfobacteraceae bacterium]